MVCFGNFIYKDIAYDRCSEYIGLMERFFPGVKWSVRRDDMTIATTDLRSALKRFGSGEPLTFVSDRIWIQKSFFQAFTKMDMSHLTGKARQDLLPIATALLEKYHDSGFEVAVHSCVSELTSWDDIENVVATLHSIMPLHGYILDNKRLWILKEGSHRMMYLCEEEEGRFVYTNCCPKFVFDLDDGFQPYGDFEVPHCLTKAFNTWKANGCQGDMVFEN